MSVFILISLICLPEALNAQDEQSRSSQQIGDDITFPALPYYSYGSGLGLTSPDSTFRLNIRFRMQNRASFTSIDQEEAVEATVRRLRLRFDGFVGDPRFLYAIQLSFAPGDVGELSDGDNINIIRDAVMFYQPNRNWNLGFGQTKLPGNRQRVNSSGALQLTDRSINNARFTIDRDFGFFIYYLREDESQFSYNIKTALSTGNGRNWTRDPGLGLAYTGRIELFPLGNFHNNGMLFEGDQYREESPKILLGATFHYNQNAQRIRGQTGSELFEERDIESFFADAMLKYSGWAFQGAYMSRKSDDPLTVNPADTHQLRRVETGDGYDLQMSYLLLSGIEFIARYSVQNPGKHEDQPVHRIRQQSAGVTKYIWEHALKLQAELTRNRFYAADPGSVASSYYLRFQVEIGI
ncbi:MAG: porin [Balneolaceae bacterium]|nr:MAG: porin [Balneolaceae bacterium]